MLENKDQKRVHKPELNIEAKPATVRPTGDATGKTHYPEHTIAGGESLWGIAQKYGISLKALYQANKDTLSPIEDASGKVFPPIYKVGQVVAIPNVHDSHALEKQFRAEHEHKGGGVYVRKGDKQTAGETKIVDDLAASAKHKQEAAEKAAAEKAAAEKHASERLAAEHKSAQHEAAMLLKELKFREVKHQGNHEGQGWLDDFSDAVKSTTGLDREHSSKAVADDFKVQEKQLEVLAKAARNQDLTQFKNLYHSYTGSEFKSGYIKPANLAFLDPGQAYSESQAQWRDNTTTAAAGIAGAALLFVPGAQGAGATMEAQVATTMAARFGIMALRTGIAAELGAASKTSLQYSNQGDKKEINEKNLVTGGVAAGTAQLAGELAIVRGAAVFAPGTHLGTRMIAASAIGGGAGGFSGAIANPVHKYYEAKEKHLPYGIKEAGRAAGDGFVAGAATGAVMGPLARLGGEGTANVIARMKVQGRVLPSASTVENDLTVTPAAASAETPKVVSQAPLDKAPPSPVDSSVQSGVSMTAKELPSPHNQPLPLSDKAVPAPVDSTAPTARVVNMTQKELPSVHNKPLAIPDKPATPSVDLPVDKTPSGVNYTGTGKFDPTFKSSAIPDKAGPAPVDLPVNKTPSGVNYTGTGKFDPTFKPQAIPDKAPSSLDNKDFRSITMPKDLSASTPKPEPAMDKTAAPAAGVERSAPPSNVADKSAPHDASSSAASAEHDALERDLFAEYKSGNNTAIERDIASKGWSEDSLTSEQLQHSTPECQASYEKAIDLLRKTGKTIYSQVTEKGEVAVMYGSKRVIHKITFKANGLAEDEPLNLRPGKSTK